MLCPYCEQENIEGVDQCERCGVSLMDLDPSGSELEQSISSTTIVLLRPKTPVTVSPSLTLREAVQQMTEQRIGSLLVEENQQLVGVFTERDLINKCLELELCLNRPISEFMTMNPDTITLKDSIAYALHAMKFGSYRHLPVVDDAGRPVGIISVRDILRYLYANLAETPAS